MDRPGYCIETYSAGSTRQSKGQLVRGPAEIIYDQAAAVGGRYRNEFSRNRGLWLLNSSKQWQYGSF